MFARAYKERLLLNQIGRALKNKKEVMSNLKFGEAIEALKSGKVISRAGWFECGIFVFKQVPATIGKETVPKMQSLPQAVKEQFGNRFNNTNNQIDAIYYTNQICWVNSSNVIQTWVPTVEDIFCDDWIIID